LNLEVVVPKEGYMLIYVSNEEKQANIAYFDDVNVTHKHSKVIQEESYYPFGMSQHYSYQRELTKEQRFKYNGIENIPDFDLNVNMYTFRTYDPALGRWWQIDPLYKHFESPYVTVTNNPIRYMDLLGLDTLRTTDAGFDWENVKNDDVVIDQHVMAELVVEGTYFQTAKKDGTYIGGGIVFTSADGQSQEKRKGSPSHESDLPRMPGGYSAKGLLNVWSSWVSLFSLTEDFYNYLFGSEDKSYTKEKNDVKPKDPIVEEKKKLKATMYEFQIGYDQNLEWDGAKYYPIVEKPDSLTLLIYWNKGKEVKRDTLRIK
ncbi:hypothetical protein C9994_09330, partial [Marivirga lumbricoides]